MSDAKAAGNFPGFIFLALALAALAIAIYFFRFRPVADSGPWPSLGKLQQIAMIAGLALFAVVVAIALRRVLAAAWQSEESSLRDLFSSVKNLDSGVVVLAAGLAISIIAFFWREARIRASRIFGRTICPRWTRCADTPSRSSVC
jgi:hypothetical protein